MAVTFCKLQNPRGFIQKEILLLVTVYIHGTKSVLVRVAGMPTSIDKKS